MMYRHPAEAMAIAQEQIKGMDSGLPRRGKSRVILAMLCSCNRDFPKGQSPNPDPDCPVHGDGANDLDFGDVTDPHEHDMTGQ